MTAVFDVRTVPTATRVEWVRADAYETDVARLTARIVERQEKGTRFRGADPADVADADRRAGMALFDRLRQR